jgi:hypothetical protein
MMDDDELPGISPWFWLVLLYFIDLYACSRF